MYKLGVNFDGNPKAEPSLLKKSQLKELFQNLVYYLKFLAKVFFLSDLDDEIWNEIIIIKVKISLN